MNQWIWFYYTYWLNHLFIYFPFLLLNSQAPSKLGVKEIGSLWLNTNRKRVYGEEKLLYVYCTRG